MMVNRVRYTHTNAHTYKQNVFFYILYSAICNMYCVWRFFVFPFRFFFFVNLAKINLNLGLYICSRVRCRNVYCEDQQVILKGFFFNFNKLWNMVNMILLPTQRIPLTNNMCDKCFTVVEIKYTHNSVWNWNCSCLRDKISLYTLYRLEAVILSNNSVCSLLFFPLGLDLLVSTIAVPSRFFICSVIRMEHRV